jgi:hypothetical protein
MKQAKNDPDYLIQKVGNTLAVWLRAELKGKDGDRLYPINENVTDSFGNVSVSEALLTVPRGQKK